MAQLSQMLPSQARVGDTELTFHLLGVTMRSLVRLLVSTKDQTVEIRVKSKQPEEIKNTTFDLIFDPLNQFKHMRGARFDTPGTDCVTTGVFSLPDQFKRRLSRNYAGDASYTEKELIERRWLSFVESGGAFVKILLADPSDIGNLYVKDAEETDDEVEVVDEDGSQVGAAAVPVAHGLEQAQGGVLHSSSEIGKALADIPDAVAAAED